MKLIPLLSILFVIFLTSRVSGHGTLIEPPQRSAIWKDPRFVHLNLPPNYNDIGQWCDGVKQDYVPQQCGVCGDPFDLPTPRPNENGGTFGNGVIAGNYTRGQVIPLIYDQVIHNGYVSVQICDDIGQESEACFQRRGYLPLNGGTTTKIPVTGTMSFTATLPPDLSCLHCVLRLYHRTAKDWGECDGVCDCPNPPGGMGCGPQELILNCADIRVSL